MTRLLFVCTANRVRSPFAEAVARRRLDPAAVQVGSAGFLEGGVRAVSEMTSAASRLGYDLSAHRSRTVDAALLTDSDLVVAMTGAHVVDLVALAPDVADRTLTLRELAAAAADDPLPPVADATALRAWAARATNRSLHDLLQEHLDVVDPHGGPRRGYRRAAADIEQLLLDALGTTQG